MRLQRQAASQRPHPRVQPQLLHLELGHRAPRGLLLSERQGVQGWETAFERRRVSWKARDQGRR
eukprot:13565572-Alexandrium_andersonii.AAC.1